MRRFTISLVLAAFALSSLAAQDLDKILNDHFKASGQDKISKITSTIMTGKAVSMGMETSMTIYQQRPDKLRIEVSVAGSKIIQSYDGTTGWIYAPLMGVTEPREMAADELKAVLNQADMDSPLWDYKAKGKNVELLGTSDDGSDYKIKVTGGEASDLIIYISTKTSLVSKVVSFQAVNGMDSEIEMEMKDYKTVRGIPTAHYMATKMSGQTVSTMTFESIEYDKSIDSALFGKPVVE